MAGSGGTPSATNPDYYDGKIPFLGISDIDGRDIEITKKTITEKGLNNSAAWIVPEGAISLAMYASVGKVGIIRQDTATSQAFYNMVFDEVSLRDFVYTRLNKAEMASEWDSLISTGTQSNLNAEKVRDFEIGIPAPEEYSLIAGHFATLDSLITLHQGKGSGLCLMTYLQIMARSTCELWHCLLVNRGGNQHGGDFRHQKARQRRVMAETAARPPPKRR